MYVYLNTFIHFLSVRRMSRWCLRGRSVFVEQLKQLQKKSVEQVELKLRFNQ